MQSMSRSPLAVVKEAYAAAQEALPQYSAARSRHTYTQWQLFALLALRHFMGLDYRSTIQLVADWSDLREALDLRTIPNYSTLCYAEGRFEKKGPLVPCWTSSSAEPASGI